MSYSDTITVTGPKDGKFGQFFLLKRSSDGTVAYLDAAKVQLSPGQYQYSQLAQFNPKWKKDNRATQAAPAPQPQYQAPQPQYQAPPPQYQMPAPMPAPAPAPQPQYPQYQQPAAPQPQYQAPPAQIPMPQPQQAPARPFYPDLEIATLRQMWETEANPQVKGHIENVALFKMLMYSQAMFSQEVLNIVQQWDETLSYIMTQTKVLSHPQATPAAAPPAPAPAPNGAPGPEAPY